MKSIVSLEEDSFKKSSERIKAQIEQRTRKILKDISDNIQTTINNYKEVL